jgi:hypothetical protein
VVRAYGSVRKTGFWGVRPCSLVDVSNACMPTEQTTRSHIPEGLHGIFKPCTTHVTSTCTPGDVENGKGKVKKELHEDRNLVGKTAWLGAGPEFRTFLHGRTHRVTSATRRTLVVNFIPWLLCPQLKSPQYGEVPQLF